MSSRTSLRSFATPWPAVAAAGLALVVLATAACGDDTVSEAPEQETVALDTTTSVVPEDAPPISIGGAPGPDGHRPVRLNPQAWERIATRFNDDDPVDPFWELNSEGHDDFWFGAEFHAETGPGWTGERGLFATDCEGAGICVRFDPDGGRGPTPTLLSQPDGEVEIDRIERGFQLTFRNLIFVQDDGVSFRIDQVTIDTT